MLTTPLSFVIYILSVSDRNKKQKKEFNYV